MHIDYPQYSNLSDKELVDRITTPPFEEECAVYIIYNRYEPLCKATYYNLFETLQGIDDFQSELFRILKGSNLDWKTLRDFRWESSLGTWLKKIAYNLAIKLYSQKIENTEVLTSLDEVKDIPANDELTLERRYRMVLLQEAINQLDNQDQKYVVFKRLQGYKSKEIAVMLQHKWDMQGITHYNNKGQAVTIDSGYIDNLFDRGYRKVKITFKELDK